MYICSVVTDTEKGFLLGLFIAGESRNCKNKFFASTSEVLFCRENFSKDFIEISTGSYRLTVASCLILFPRLKRKLFKAKFDLWSNYLKGNSLWICNKIFKYLAWYFIAKCSTKRLCLHKDETDFNRFVSRITRTHKQFVAFCWTPNLW